MLKRSIVSSLSMLFLLGLVGCSLNLPRLLLEQTMDPLPPAIATRTISQNQENLLIWHKSQINIRNLTFPSPGLLVGQGYVAYINFLGGPLSKINQMDVLEANSGATLWQSESFATYEDAAISKDRAFVVLDRGNPFNIYEIKGDSKPLYSFNYFDKATKFYLYPSIIEKDFYFYYINGNGFTLHHLDLAGKEVASPYNIPAPLALSSLFLFDQPFFLSTGAEYTGGNFETGEELWRIPAPGRIDSWPVLLKDTLIISTGDGRRYMLMAIDIKNGRELWRTEKIFGSNVLLHKNELYILRNDAILVKIDSETGQIKGENISFNPPSLDAGFWAYNLASDGERLFVYFGDSQELFALKTP